MLTEHWLIGVNGKLGLRKEFQRACQGSYTSIYCALLREYMWRKPRNPECTMQFPIRRRTSNLFPTADLCTLGGKKCLILRKLTLYTRLNCFKTFITHISFHAGFHHLSPFQTKPRNLMIRIYCTPSSNRSGAAFHFCVPQTNTVSVSWRDYKQRWNQKSKECLRGVDSF